MGAEVIIFGQSLNSQFLKGLTHSALFTGAGLASGKTWDEKPLLGRHARDGDQPAQAAGQHGGRLGGWPDWAGLGASGGSQRMEVGKGRARRQHLDQFRPHGALAAWKTIWRPVD